MPPAPTNNQAATTDFNTAYQEFGNVYNPQVDAVNTQLAALPGQQATQQASLDQAKTNAFTNNALTANARGIMYSGYTPAQNTSYTTNTYNPAVTKLNTDFTTQKQTLTDKINAINQQRSNDANSLVQNTVQAQQQAAAEAAKEQATAAREAANAAKSAGALPSTAQVRIAINQGLSSVKGGDGYVSPQDYATALGDWLAAGQSRNSFNNEFKNYRNPTNTYYDYAIKAAGL